MSAQQSETDEDKEKSGKGLAVVIPASPQVELHRRKKGDNAAAVKVTWGQGIFLFFCLSAVLFSIMGTVIYFGFYLNLHDESKSRLL